MEEVIPHILVALESPEYLVTLSRDVKKMFSDTYIPSGHDYIPGDVGLFIRILYIFVCMWTDCAGDTPPTPSDIRDALERLLVFTSTVDVSLDQTDRVVNSDKAVGCDPESIRELVQDLANQAGANNWQHLFAMDQTMNMRNATHFDANIVKQRPTGAGGPGAKKPRHQTPVRIPGAARQLSEESVTQARQQRTIPAASQFASLVGRKQAGYDPTRPDVLGSKPWPP